MREVFLAKARAKVHRMARFRPSRRVKICYGVKDRLRGGALTPPETSTTKNLSSGRPRAQRYILAAFKDSREWCAGEARQLGRARCDLPDGHPDGRGREVRGLRGRR